MVQGEKDVNGKPDTSTELTWVIQNSLTYFIQCSHRDLFFKNILL